jgi:hypothetical protein
MRVRMRDGAPARSDENADAWQPGAAASSPAAAPTTTRRSRMAAAPGARATLSTWASAVATQARKPRGGA